MKTMTKILSALALLVGLGLPGLASATTTNPAEAMKGQWVVWTISLPSQAQNAIDTSLVATDNLHWEVLPNATAASAVVQTVLTLQFLGASGVDSTNIGVDVSVDGSAWTEVYSLNNINSNLTTTVNNKNIAISRPVRFIRLRCKNVDGTTGIATVWIAGVRKR